MISDAAHIIVKKYILMKRSGNNGFRGIQPIAFILPTKEYYIE